MAKSKKNAEHNGSVEPVTLESRIRLFFETQPFGHPATTGDMMIDISEKELSTLISDDEAAAVVKRMETDKISLPDKKADKLAVARANVVKATLDKMANAGQLERTKLSDLDGAEIGYTFKGKRSDTAKPAGELARVPIDRIKADAKNYQARAKSNLSGDGLNQAVVDRYAAVADRLPPMDVYDIGDDKLILVDGFHRYGAYKQAGVDVVPVNIVKGTKEEAKLAAIRANSGHGFSRTMDDIKAAVALFLGMPGNKNASVASVAKAVDCAWATADKCCKFWRKQWGQTEKSETPPTEKKPDTTEPVPTTPVPTGEAPAVPEAGTDTGVYDRLGNPVPADLVPAFTDTRFRDAIANIRANVAYILNIRPDGYAISSVPFKGRLEDVGEVEFYLDRWVASLPYCVCPKDAGTVNKQLASAVRRGWMDEKEYREYVKGGGKGGKPVESGSGETAPAETSHVRGTDEGEGQPATEGVADATATAA